MMRGVRNQSTARAVAVGFTVLALALVGAAAGTLADNQADQRRDLRDRYVDRTAVTASLVDSLFRVAFTGQARDASDHLAGKVSAAPPAPRGARPPPPPPRGAGRPRNPELRGRRRCKGQRGGRLAAGP